jgi:hypothetical protein
MRSTYGSTSWHGVYGVLMTKEEWDKKTKSMQDFGKVLVQECPHVGHSPEGEPLAGSGVQVIDGKLHSPEVYGRLFINEGWFPLVLRTAKKIEAEIMKLPEEDRQYYYIGQVKEKFAGLKFYMHTPCGAYVNYEGVPKLAEPGWNKAAIQIIQQITDDADRESYGICEECGKPGEPRMYSWQLTHCDDCFKSDDLCPDAWEGCIVIEPNRVHSEHGSFPIEDK